MKNANLKLLALFKFANYSNPYAIDTSLGLSCLGSYGGPIFPYLVYAGANSRNESVKDSRAIVLTFTVSGSNKFAQKAKDWEKA